MKADVIAKAEAGVAANAKADAQALAKHKPAAKHRELKPEDARVRIAQLQALANKLHVGDLVQGWKNAASPRPEDKDDYNAGHSFFVVDIERAATGDVTRFQILTANSGAMGGGPAGVSRQWRKFDQWAELCIARMYESEGEQ